MPPALRPITTHREARAERRSWRCLTGVLPGADRQASEAMLRSGSNLYAARARRIPARRALIERSIRANRGNSHTRVRGRVPRQRHEGRAIRLVL